MLLITAAAYFATPFLGQRLQLKIRCEKLLILSRRLGGVPAFRFDALSDRIQRILSRSAPPPSRRTAANIPTGTTPRMQSLRKSEESPRTFPVDKQSVR